MLQHESRRRRSTSSHAVVRCCRHLEFRELFSMVLEPCEVRFSASPPATHCSCQMRSGHWRTAPRPDQWSTALAKCGQLYPRAFCGDLGASQFHSISGDTTHSLRGQCGARAASQRTESTAATFSFTARRCAPSPCATLAPIPHSSSSPRGVLSRCPIEPAI